MSDNRLEALQQFADIAKRAEIDGQVQQDPLRWVSEFEIPGGRSQVVYVRHSADDVEGSTLVTVFSPCKSFNNLDEAGMTHQRAIELLAMNEQMSLARYGIWDSPKEKMVVASADLFLNRLDPSELRATTWHVAIAADAYERKFQQDEY